MAAEIGLLSVTQIQKLSQPQHQLQNQHHHQNQPNPNSLTGPWMWNPREHPEEDDSWEVRAFAEDTRNVMGTTWPPRSYTCTFCRREFRSAQALGGHMNVHRRDRARLHQAQPASSLNPNSSPTSSFIIPAQELVGNGGLCLLYHLPSPNGTFTAATPTTLNNACGESLSPPTLRSISPYPPSNLISTSFDFPAPSPAGINISSYCNSAKLEEAATSSSSADNGHEEIDLELRLGHRPAPT